MMKTIRKPLAILLALTMLLTMLTACGKSPAQSFFDLCEEAAKVTDCDFEYSMGISIDEGDVDVSLSGSSYQSINQAQLTGSVGGSVSGVKGEVSVPEILIDGQTIYVNTADLVDLLQVIIGEDLSDLFDAKYIEIGAEDSSDSEEAVKELQELFAGTGAKLKQNILERKDVVVKNKDGSYTLTLDGTAMLELVQIVLDDLSDNRKDYINAILDLYPDSDTLSKDALNELWDEYEDMADEIDEDFLDEYGDDLKDISATMTIAKNKDRSYSISAEVVYDDRDNGFTFSVASTVNPVKHPEEFKVPRDTVTIEELMEEFGSVGDYGYDDDDGDDNTDIVSNDGDDVPAYLQDTKRVGNDEAGYIDVPSEFVLFQEEGGLSGDVESYQYSDPTGKTIFTISGYEGVDAKAVADALLEGLEEDGAEDATGAETTIAGYDAYQVYCYYPDENLFLVMWVFETAEHDDLVHFVGIEFDADEYTDVWLLSETFGFDKDSTIDVTADVGGDEEVDWSDFQTETGGLDQLNLTKINDDISEFTYLSYGDVELKAPVLNDADWDDAYISTSYTMVDVNDEDYNWTVTYSSSDAAWYDLEQSVKGTVDYYNESGYDMTATDVVTSADGKTQAAAFYGELYGNQMVYYVIASDFGEDVSTLDFVIYGDSVSIQPILDYYGLTDPMAGR